MTQKQIRNVLSVLKRVREELAKRDELYNGENIGLCVLIMRHFIHTVVYVNIAMFIPEFTKEYCHTIVPTIDDETGFWWPTNILRKNHICYDVTSRLKVIDHFIDLYTSKLTSK